MSVRGTNDSKSQVTLPITPMLDMTFQLLFFFIVNFHPADLEGEMAMALPVDAEIQAKDQKDVKKESKTDKDAEPEFPSDLTVKVRTQLDGTNDGEISAIFIRNLEGKEEPVDGLDGLKTYLVDKRESLTNKEAIKVQGDGKLKVRNVMKVMDKCREAGFGNVSFVPPEDFGR
jgi:biopolymer transport protein ExbD